MSNLGVAGSAKFFDKLPCLMKDVEELKVPKYNSVDNIKFPLKRGFIEVINDTTYSETPQLQLYWSDGSAKTIDDLYIFPLIQRKNII